MPVENLYEFSFEEACTIEMYEHSRIYILRMREPLRGMCTQKTFEIHSL